MKETKFIRICAEDVSMMADGTAEVTIGKSVFTTSFEDGYVHDGDATAETLCKYGENFASPCIIVINAYVKHDDGRVTAKQIARPCLMIEIGRELATLACGITSAAYTYGNAYIIENTASSPRLVNLSKDDVMPLVYCTMSSAMGEGLTTSCDLERMFKCAAIMEKASETEFASIINGLAELVGMRMSRTCNVRVWKKDAVALLKKLENHLAASR